MNGQPMRRLAAFLFLLVFFSSWGHATAEQDSTASPPVILQIHLNDQSINPVTTRFILRAIQQSEQKRTECLIIVLDTPGGLVDSTRDVVKAILGSQVPVVVYVAPSGARAASAGVFITQASHVAAMAPGTHIGAAHPVQISGLPGPSPTDRDGEKKDEDRSPIDKKILNDTVAWARALAELRGRNAEWAAKAVAESASISSSEAVAERVVDLIAIDTGDLLRKLDGREVKLHHKTIRLNTKDADVRILPMWWGERLLGVLSSPNVAFILLIVGFYGVLFELYSPGWGISGTLGIVCLLLAFFGLAVLPVNYVALALVLVAMALFVAEAFVTSYGALTAAGILCLLFGGMMLVDSPAGFQRVSFSVVAPVALATGLITVFLVGSIVRSHRGKIQTGSEAFTGAEAVAVEDFSVYDGRHFGTIKVQGELWRAVSPRPVTAGQVVRIAGREGLTMLLDAAEQASQLSQVQSQA